MDTQQIINDIELVRDILSADASPARRAAAAALLRAAADAIEAQYDTPMNIGDIILDNDPRTSGRMLVIESFDDNTHVIAKPIANHASTTIRRKSRIARANIYLDDKPRKTGFTLQPNH